MEKSNNVDEAEKFAEPDNEENETEETAHEPSSEEAHSDEEITLGGGIKLIGFKNLESGFLTVVKKMVGNYVRHIEEKIGKGSIELYLQKDKEYKLALKMIINEKEYSAEAVNKNLFFVINEVFNKFLSN